MVLDFLGNLGGTIFLILIIIEASKRVYEYVRKFNKYKDAYDELRARDKEEEEQENVPKMGFMTTKERDEMEAKLKSCKRA